MATRVKTRDRRCRFPGCTIAAVFCDIDHVTPWPHGPTHDTNLLSLCRRHHRIKQRLRWNLTLTPDGIATWTDPTGRVRTTHPTNALHTSVLPDVTSTPTARGSDQHQPGPHRAPRRTPQRTRVPPRTPHRTPTRPHPHARHQLARPARPTPRRDPTHQRRHPPRTRPTPHRHRHHAALALPPHPTTAHAPTTTTHPRSDQLGHQRRSSEMGSGASGLGAGRSGRPSCRSWSWDRGQGPRPTPHAHEPGSGSVRCGQALAKAPASSICSTISSMVAFIGR